MNIEIDTTAKALYLRLATGRVADTIELAESVIADVDESGAMLGIEFIHVDRFAPFIAAHPELISLPPSITYTSLDRGKAWQVEVGSGERMLADERRGRTAELNGIFLADIVAKPDLMDQITDGATVRLDLAVAWT
ncbi:MAG: DUF2283 domain-containing protein [Chloroflexota bacterium]|nr:DUF2283 domain-containing protein [Chloroflexota bacterium]